MENLSAEFNAWQDSAVALYHRLIAYLPDVIGAVIVLIIGWVVAQLLAAGAIRLANGINTGLGRAFDGRFSEHLRLSETPIRIISRIVFWVVMLLFLTLASRIAGLDAFFGWLDQTVTYLPTLLAGILIIAGGYLFSILARDIATSALDTAGVELSENIGRVVQYATFFTAIVIGVDQIGIDVSFLVTLVAIAVAAILSGFAIAFGFGAREYVANLIAARALHKQYSPGQRIRIDNIEGNIVSLTPTDIVLDTEQGRMSVPASTLSRTPSLLVSGDTGADT